MKSSRTLRVLFSLSLLTTPLIITACATSSEQEVAQEVVVTGIAAQNVARMSLSKPQELSYQPAPKEYRDDFEEFEINRITQVSETPVSTFSADVDTASYSFVRKRLNAGYLPPKDAVRLEEMVNYFDYQYPVPTSRTEPFKASIYVHDAPWAKDKKLIHIGIQGYEIEPEVQPDSNLVFLLDVSGSMDAPDKLPLVKQSMELLLSQLKPTDTIAIVVYAGAAGVVLPPTEVSEKTVITQAMDGLQAGGSTAGAEGIQLAYQLAQQNFKEGAVNRIILATDGDFNVGITDREQLQDFVERKRNEGIYLSVLGFGQGNYQDYMMQTLAQNGNGVAAYIDTLSEAQKVLVHEATSSLFPIATDLKLQMEFNPAKVREYRLLGYETRALNREDFNNDKVDAGDIGSGHSVTAIYEIALVDSEDTLIDDLRYGDKSTDDHKTVNNIQQELALLRIRYKRPGETESELSELPIANEQAVDATLKQEANFATAVAGFAQLLKDDKYLKDWHYDDAIDLAQANKGDDDYGYRTELVQLIRKAKVAKAMQQ